MAHGRLLPDLIGERAGMSLTVGRASAVTSILGVMLVFLLLAGCTESPRDEAGGNSAANSSVAGRDTNANSSVDHDSDSSANANSNPTDAANERSVAYRTEVMGTWGTVTIVTADSTASGKVASAALETWHHVDRLLSNWKETSELSRMNGEAGSDTVAVDRELAFVLGRALEVADASGGAFDVTVEPLVRLWGFLGGTPHVPDAADIDAVRARTGWKNVWLDPLSHRVRFGIPGLKVDLGGIAKGYGVDLAYQVLREAGVSGMVDLSGNIRTLGTPPGRDAWYVGVRDPRDRVPYFARLKLHEAAMATSGQYEQFVAKDGKKFGHILDPRTGWPAEGLLSVTVLATSATDADAWATALFVMGPEKARETAKLRADLGVILVEDGQGGKDVVWVEDEVGEAFELVSGVEFVEVREF